MRMRYDHFVFIGHQYWLFVQFDWKTRAHKIGRNNLKKKLHISLIKCTFECTLISVKQKVLKSKNWEQSKIQYFKIFVTIKPHVIIKLLKEKKKNVHASFEYDLVTFYNHFTQFPSMFFMTSKLLTLLCERNFFTSK